MMTDLRFACRQLLESPGFTLIAPLTLAIGIGLNTAIFRLIDDLLLRGLPFKDTSSSCSPTELPMPQAIGLPVCPSATNQ
ncbi:MAG TPA: hypothetical protein VFX12_04780 [Vicinamibacterales bacterium]|nr:hypothetical protein [Vicinamibacterales bacterium]